MISQDELWSSVAQQGPMNKEFSNLSSYSSLNHLSYRVPRKAANSDDYPVVLNSRFRKGP